MRSMIVNAIDAACRLALRIGLGLRMPESRIRIEIRDLTKKRDYAKQRADMAALETHYWITQEERLYARIDCAKSELDELQTSRAGLSLPAPTRPIGDL